MKSINYEFRDQILKYDPVKFRKVVEMFSVEIEKIQLEFCNGTVETCFDGKDTTTNMPLLQMFINEIDLSMSEHLMDNSFNPASKIIENLETKRYKVYIKDKPPVLEIDASLKLESNYFNQITQVFEPFLEPWTLKGHITQKEEHGLFDASLTST